MERRPLGAPLARRPLNITRNMLMSVVTPVPLLRRPLVPPTLEHDPTPKVPAPVAPAPSGRTRHPMAGPAPLPVEQWPDRVYGYHPLLPDAQVICIRRDVPGYSEVSSEINPHARNREMGVSEEIAEAVIRAAWAPGGTVWHKGYTYD